MGTDAEIEREIQDKGLTAPRVTPESIAEKIKGEFYFTASQGAYGAAGESFKGNPDDIPEALHRLTFCVLVLENGFTVTGQSAPASATNFDPELGRKIARADAVNKIWPLEGYLLRELLAEDERRELLKDSVQAQHFGSTDGGL